MTETGRATGLCPVCHQSFYLNADGFMPTHLPTAALRASRRRGAPCYGTGQPPITRSRCAVCGRLYRITNFGTIATHPVGRSTKTKNCPGSDRQPRDPTLPLQDSQTDFEIRITAVGQPGTGRRR